MSSLAGKANLHINGSDSRLNEEDDVIKIPASAERAQQSRQARGSLHGGDIGIEPLFFKLIYF